MASKTTAMASARNENGEGTTDNTVPVTKKKKPASFREQHRYVPLSNVGKIMKKVVPSQGKVAKEAKQKMQECVSEFISFITSEANDKVLQEKRKTVTGEDILWAMRTLGFDKYVGPLRVYLQKYKVKTRTPSSCLKPVSVLVTHATFF